MALQISRFGRFFKIKNTSSGSIKAYARDDVRFKIENEKLIIIKGETLPILVINSVSDVSSPSASSLEDLLNKLSILT